MNVEPSLLKMLQKRSSAGTLPMRRTPAITLQLVVVSQTSTSLPAAFAPRLKRHLLLQRIRDCDSRRPSLSCEAVIRISHATACSHCHRSHSGRPCSPLVLDPLSLLLFTESGWFNGRRLSGCSQRAHVRLPAPRRQVPVPYPGCARCCRSIARFMWIWRPRRLLVAANMRAEVLFESLASSVLAAVPSLTQRGANDGNRT